MPTSKKALILLASIAIQFVLFYFLASLTIFPKNNSQNQIQSIKSPYIGPYIINVHSAEIEESFSDNALENITRTENAVPMPSDQAFKKRQNSRLAFLEERIGNPENLKTEKVAYFPEKKNRRKEYWEKSYKGKKVKTESGKIRIQKLGNRRQLSYSGSLPGKKDISENNNLSSEKNTHLNFILSKINLEKYYPLNAKKRGIQGDALLRFALKTDGRLQNLNIIKSSGSRILDTAALKTVNDAAPFPFINGSIDIVLSYHFDE